MANNSQFFLPLLADKQHLELDLNPLLRVPTDKKLIFENKK
jgi:hypothetical protein